MTNPSIDEHGTQRWYKNDKLHRTDGPAVLYTNGTQYWYQNGKLHRTDGPSVIYEDGTQRWNKNGKLHREDGPAILYANGSQTWWLNDIKYDFDEYVKVRFPHDCKEKIIFLLKYQK